MILAVIWGIAFAKMDVEAHKQDALFLTAFPSNPVLNRVTRAQPAIYPPDKALTWVEDYYERTYVSSKKKLEFLMKYHFLNYVFYVDSSTL